MVSWNAFPGTLRELLGLTGHSKNIPRSLFVARKKTLCPGLEQAPNFLEFNFKPTYSKQKVPEPARTQFCISTMSSVALMSKINV
jgi:hypothetical protein